jgi:predicted DNA-binding protein
VELQIPLELEEKLNRLAAQTGRTADQVALDLLAHSVEYDEWFHAESKKAASLLAKGDYLTINKSVLA